MHRQSLIFWSLGARLAHAPEENLEFLELRQEFLQKTARKNQLVDSWGNSFFADITCGNAIADDSIGA